MNYVISSIGMGRTTYPNKDLVEKQMLTLPEYRDLTKRVISKWAPPSIRTLLLNSEDAIGFISYGIMLGDWKFDPLKSRDTTCRGYHGKRYMQRYIQRMATQKANQSLDYTMDDEGLSIADITVDASSYQPDVIMENKEEDEQNSQNLNLIMGVLNDTQKKVLSMQMYDNKNVTQIAQEMGMTKEGVRRSIKNGLQLLREVVGVPIS